MQVILRKNVSNLGLTGDVMSVANGYYRNYLEPRGLAFTADPGSLRQVEHQKRIIAAGLAAQQEVAIELKKKIEDQTITLNHQSGANNKIFGSITSQEIAMALKKMNFPVDRKMVQLANPIRMVGEHAVKIRLHPEITAEVRVTVVGTYKPEAKKEARQEEAAPAEAKAESDVPEEGEEKAEPRKAPKKKKSE